VCADCAVNDDGEWIIVSASSEVNKADRLEANITSHLRSAKRILDDVNSRVVALNKSDRFITSSQVTSAACDADVAVSKNKQFIYLMLHC